MGTSRRGGVPAAATAVSFPGVRTERDLSRLAPEVFALPARLAETRRRKVVVALDEFQAIGGFNGGSVEPVLVGLQQPQGILVRDGQLYAVDAGAKTLTSLDLETKAKTVIASELPVGAPEGVSPKPLRGIAPFTGPQGPFAGITAGADGTLYVSGDAEGSVLALRYLPDRAPSAATSPAAVPVR